MGLLGNTHPPNSSPMSTRFDTSLFPLRLRCWAAVFVCLTASSSFSCADKSPSLATKKASPAPSSSTPPSSSAASSASAGVMVARPSKPRLGVRGFATLVYAKPNKKARRLGYLRVGERVPRSAKAVTRRGCKGGFYRIEPEGYVCVGKDATLDLNDSLVRAAWKRPNRDRPLPYRYGFVRSVLPLYLRVPPAKRQFASEFKLKEHLEWFAENRDEVQRAELGALDVAVHPDGTAVAGKKVGELGRARNSAELRVGELFGGDGKDRRPFWLKDSQRLVPNISGFEVPKYAWFADRARRHTGLAFVGSFTTNDYYLKRRFAITTDLRLAPTSKVKPDSGSSWHGLELGKAFRMPLAFVRFRGARAYRLTADGAEPTDALPRRAAFMLAGKVKRVDGEKYYRLKDGRWLRRRDVGTVLRPSKWPRVARKGKKWIEIDLSEQTLTLWEGKIAVFATLISSGRPAIADPSKSYSTVRGIFNIYAKHLSATMDSDEGMGKRQNKENRLKPGDKGYVPTRGDGVYGVTKRRGHGLFKLRDVPHIQYFHKNYALHGAYWHDVFGVARSHGCINLAPADSLRVFKWTDPKVPAHWHGIRSGSGTTVVVHK